MLDGLFDITELIKRIIKYLVEGFMVSVVCYIIPKRSLNLEEIALISLTAAATFCILDTYLPSFSVPSRSAAAAGVGFGLVGGLPVVGI